MSVRTRFNLVSILGILFLGLVLHNVASFRLRIILERESLGYLIRRLPGSPLAAVGGLLAVACLFLAILWLIHRRLSAAKSRGRGFLVTAPLGLAFLAAGIAVVWLNPRFPAPQEWSGFAAAVVGISIVFWAFLPSKRALVVAHLVLLVVAAVALDAPRRLGGHRAKSKAILGFMEAAEEDLERRRQTWSLADPEEVLAHADSWASRHKVYRFDEHPGDVIRVEAERADGGSGVLFEMPRDGRFVPHGPEGPAPTIAGRTQLLADYRGGSAFRTEDPVPLLWSEVGAFQITMKVSRGNSFQLFWGEKMGLKKSSIRIPLAPPGESASYVIKERSIRHAAEGEVGHIWIVPSDQDARVEIESFRVLDRIQAVLGGAPFAAGYESVDDEFRRVLFVSTPCRLTYNVEVPPNEPRLLFGLTASQGSPSTTFSVTVTDGGRERTVFSTAWEDDTRWSDYEVDLSPWAGKAVELHLEAAAEKPGLGIWSNPVLLGEPSRAPNVVVYLVDCLRADHLGAYGYARETSPFFDRFVSEGTLFERAYSNGPTTKLSLPSLFSSNPVASTGVRYSPDVLPDRFPTLAEVLRTMGFATGAFATNGIAGPYSGTHQGFSSLFDHKRIVREAGPEYTDADAEALVGDLLNDWIARNRDRNFFLYVHTMDAHGVYDPPETYRRFYEQLESGTRVEWNEVYDPPWESAPTGEGRRALYDGEIAYGDFHFGRFVGMLEEAGVLENTIIVFMADHGEYFGEHRMWGHVAPCFRQGTHIPLLISGPGFPKGARIAQNVQILDVMPTLLDAVGLDPDPVLFQGRSLVPLAQGRAPEAFDSRTIFVDGGRPGETAFYCGDYHVLPEKNILFDLAADPDEEVYLNEFLLDFPVKSAARRLVEEYNRTYAELCDIMSVAGGDALQVDPETLDQLRALGYID